MNKTLPTLGFLGVAALRAFAGEPALTIYNQDFAVVRDTVPLDLKEGVNDVSFADTTAHLEPASVILRDPTGKVQLQVLEQNYRNDPVSQELLLSLFEGRTINFFIKGIDKPDETIAGKIIRSGYVAHPQPETPSSGWPYYQPAVVPNPATAAQPIIEVNGKIQFGLPGLPIFPSLGDDTNLKPVLSWKLAADAPAQLDAELAYITDGMSWEADYNVVAPEAGDVLDIIGWVTMNNQSGKTFQNATIKLMAGDVNKTRGQRDIPTLAGGAAALDASMPASVTEKTFDEYHLYTLPKAVTLHDGETKQVEFIHAEGVQSQKIYVYDGLNIDLNHYNGWALQSIRQDEQFGTQSQTKVAVMREFKNSADNHLGMPLPKGKLRFYKQDANQLEFIGDNVIDHTPKDELIRVYTGNAFDLVGERQRTNFKADYANAWLDESFTIKVRNHKQEPVEIRVVEHLYRWINWEISGNTDPFVKTNAQAIEFRVKLEPDEEKTVSYKVHYSW